MSDQDQIIEAVDPAVLPADMGACELPHGASLKQMLRDNVEKAQSFSNLLDTARANTQLSVDALEAQYLEIAEKLTDKIEEQHKEQVERLEGDKRRVRTWLSEYVDEVKRVKQRVKMDPIDQIRAKIESIREAQEQL